MDGGLATFHDLAPAEESFAEALVEGLSRPAKAIPCKFLYDAAGSALFEQICELPEYYPTRTEIAILERHGREMASALGDGPVIELGSGSSRKIRILLDQGWRPAAYVPVEISQSALGEAAASLALAYPHLPVIAVAADYTRPFRLPPLPPGRRSGFFPGSTIGNFDPEEAVRFLGQVAELLGEGGTLLIGVDLEKDKAVLDAAYDDAAGVTAAFNLNLLARANRELGADFDLEGFRHEAFYNPARHRVELYLVSRYDQDATVVGRRIRFRRGERIHTEYSYKYTVEAFAALAGRAGFRPAGLWTDADRLFSLHALRVR